MLQGKFNNQTYIGSTNNLRKRLQQHNSGKEKSTKRYMPWNLIYYEAYKTEELARAREKRLKYNGNAIRELKKRVGLIKSGDVEGLPSTAFFKKSGAGFTLIEVLVVIALIGVLATLIMVSLNTSRERAKIAKAQTEISQIYMAIFLLEDDSAQWPGHKTPYKKQCISPGNQNNEICVYPPDNCDYGLNDEESGITKNDSANPYPHWRGPYYMPEVPKDPWGNEYFLDTDYYIGGACRVVIGSAGPNGISNIKNDNPGDPDDIIYIISAE